MCTDEVGEGGGVEGPGLLWVHAEVKEEGRVVGREVGILARLLHVPVPQRHPMGTPRRALITHHHHIGHNLVERWTSKMGDVR